MPARNITNTVTDKTSTRLKAHLDGPRNDAGAKKVIEYSDGTEVTVERTGGPATDRNGRVVMKESRIISKTKTPPTHVGQTPWKPGQYERVFGHS